MDQTMGKHRTGAGLEVPWAMDLVIYISEAKAR